MAKDNNYQCRLINKYNDEVMKQLSSTLNITNVMRLPKMEKIVLNMGIGDAKEHKNWLSSGIEELSTISGQKAVATFSKKAISNFKIRKGFPVGCKVTLRKNYMYEFLERLCAVALPRTRDFRGLSSKSFDGQGNYSFGIKEQVVFPEIDYDKVDTIRGMDVIITTSAGNDEISYEMLKAMGLPIKEKGAQTEEVPVEEVPIQEDNLNEEKNGEEV